mgnify:CR=1 FL=1
MKRVLTFVFAIMIAQVGFSQETNQAKQLLDEVSEKMGAYINMQINFSTSLINKEAGIKENDEPPHNGSITLKGEKYNLDYLKCIKAIYINPYVVASSIEARRLA